jgi:hypothetical protein
MRRPGLVVAGEIDLVDGEHHMADAGQGHDRRMAAGLGQEPLSSVDEEHREVGTRGARRHVARILLVAGRVRDDEGAPRGRHVAVGDIDRDPLLALGLEPIDQQGEVDIVAIGSMTSRIALERGELVVVDEALLVEQPPDESRLSVVDRPTCEKPQGRQRGSGSRLRIGTERRRRGLEHQK